MGKGGHKKRGYRKEKGRRFQKLNTLTHASSVNSPGGLGDEPSGLGDREKYGCIGGRTPDSPPLTGFALAASAAAVAAEAARRWRTMKNAAPPTTPTPAIAAKAMTALLTAVDEVPVAEEMASRAALLPKFEFAQTQASARHAGLQDPVTQVWQSESV